MKIQRVKIKDFKGIECCDLTLNGNHCYVEGHNGSGKTSFIEAIEVTLGFKTSKEVGEAVRHGAAKSEIRVDFQDDGGRFAYIVERQLTEHGKPKLKVSAPGGEAYPAQEWFERFIDKVAVDPVAFLGKSPKEQISDVLRVCNVQPPVAKVKEITGEDLPAGPGESAADYLARLASESGELYVRRRLANTSLQNKQKALQEAERRVAALGPVSADATPLADLLRRRETLDRERDAYQSATKTLESKLQQLGGARTLLTQLQQERADLLERLAKLDERIDAGKTKIDIMTAEADGARTALSELADPQPAITALNEHILAQQKNQQGAAAVQERDRLAREADEAKTVHEKLDQQLAAVRDLAKDLLAGVDLGVPDVTIAEGDIRLRGTLLKGASRAERIRFACAVCFRRNPEAKILLIDNAESLDNTSWAIVLEEANRRGWHCIGARVRDAAALQFEVFESLPGESLPTGVLHEVAALAGR